jgi:hypothetical protein
MLLSRAALPCGCLLKFGVRLAALADLPEAASALWKSRLFDAIIAFG